MKDWNIGATIGAVLALGVVFLNAVGVIGWLWLVATSPMVISGGVCGALLGGRLERRRYHRRAKLT